MTAYHNLVPGQAKGYAFASALFRTIDGALDCEINSSNGFRLAKVGRYNKIMDYAILIDVSGAEEQLVHIPISLSPIESYQDLKVFHAPVSVFNDGPMNSLSIYVSWVKSSAVCSRHHHVTCMGGLSQGSSGAPFVARDGRVIGMHLESISGVVDSRPPEGTLAADALELVSDTAGSLINNHASYCEGLIISKCPQLVADLRRQGIISS